MAQLRVRRWTKHGHDRLYVSAGAARVGWEDLATGRRSLELAHLEAEFSAAIAQWRSRNRDARPVTDYAAQAAGAGLDAKAREVRPSRLLRLLASVFGVRTRDWAWRRGAAGEREVGGKLGKLPPGWRVLHGVQLGRGGDIDHLLIGPAGVFTVNTKHHKRARVQVGRKVVFVNGRPWGHIRQAEREAGRVRDTLRAQLGRPVHVGPLVVVHGQASVRGWLRHCPAGVRVLPSWAVRAWFRVGGRPVLSPAEVDAVFELARRPETWRTA